MIWVDADVADELAALLESTAATADHQADCIQRIEFALKYYGSPELYYSPVTDGAILDGGLRARTALGLLKPAYHGRLPARTHQGATQ